MSSKFHGKIMHAYAKESMNPVSQSIEARQIAEAKNDASVAIAACTFSPKLNKNREMANNEGRQNKLVT